MVNQCFRAHLIKLFEKSAFINNNGFKKCVFKITIKRLAKYVEKCCFYSLNI